MLLKNSTPTYIESTMSNINFIYEKAVIEALQNFQNGQTPKHDQEMDRCKKEIAKMGLDISNFTDENIACLAIQKSGFLEEIILPFQINILGIRYQALSELMLNWVEYQSELKQRKQLVIKDRLVSQLGENTANSLLNFFDQQHKTLHIIE